MFCCVLWDEIPRMIFQYFVTCVDFQIPQPRKACHSCDTKTIRLHDYIELNSKERNSPWHCWKSSYQKKRLAEGSIPEEGSSNNRRSGSPSIALAKQTYSTKKIIWTVSSNVTIFSALVDDQRALQTEGCVVHQTSKHFVITDVRNKPYKAWHWTVDKDTAST